MINKTIILSLLMLINFFFKGKDQHQYTLHGYAQGTDYTIKYSADSAIVSGSEVDSILIQIDSSMSLYKPYSLISKFNTSTKSLSIDEHFRIVMNKSFEIYKDTKGKFDVTVAPLVQAWGFGPKPITLFPDSAKIKELLKDVGMNLLQLKGKELIKTRPGITIDLNGIAQGYSVDVVADYLLRKGVKSFVVEIGGEIRMKGTKPDGSVRRIGIEGPALNENTEPQIRHVISFNEGAVTTSGNYRKYLKTGGKKISHLINPKTGYPLDNQLISVTIYAKDAITADGYDNAVMAMDVEEALAFVSARKNMEAYIIYHRRDGSVTDTLTTGFRKMIVN
ncbi:thiamine biosynthesis lipoprotein [Pedobacter cryoconitis]|uniref:FAD:protein FMN transferase n=1 Tax=Pedobacter cryoconitis TaxID=188932 RepID=A0A7W8ZQ83_9SPHI|nr:FAD:protein FMN transferase [Pedobacter cryoconitis]MBB5638172.1 thiamine biosynthesis lipoprotein [Pedobacter cryoconitis]